MDNQSIQYLPDNYNIPFDVNLLKDGFYIRDFIDLLSKECAAFFIESESRTNYKMIFNTYNYIEKYDSLTVYDKFRLHLEQKKRQFYADYNNLMSIIEMNPLFMVIYMYEIDGYRVGACPTAQGTFEFGGFASPAFYERLISNKTQI